jgi:hypothetical protein
MCFPIPLVLAATVHHLFFRKWNELKLELV